MTLAELTIAIAHEREVCRHLTHLDDVEVKESEIAHLVRERDALMKKAAA